MVIEPHPPPTASSFASPPSHLARNAAKSHAKTFGASVLLHHLKEQNENEDEDKRKYN